MIFHFVRMCLKYLLNFVFVKMKEWKRRFSLYLDGKSNAWAILSKYLQFLRPAMGPHGTFPRSRHHQPPQFLLAPRIESSRAVQAAFPLSVGQCNLHPLFSRTVKVQIPLRHECVGSAKFTSRRKSHGGSESSASGHVRDDKPCCRPTGGNSPRGKPCGPADVAR